MCVCLAPLVRNMQTFVITLGLTFYTNLLRMKSLNITKTKSKAVNRRKTDNEKRQRNDLQNNTQKTKDQTTRTALKIKGEQMCSARVSSSSSTCGSRRVNLAI
jgi:23S rRNA pseudoU1915 N3-methylase RlmH